MLREYFAEGTHTNKIQTNKKKILCLTNIHKITVTGLLKKGKKKKIKNIFFWHMNFNFYITG